MKTRNGHNPVNKCLHHGLALIVSALLPAAVFAQPEAPADLDDLQNERLLPVSEGPDAREIDRKPLADEMLHQTH